MRCAAAGLALALVSGFALYAIFLRSAGVEVEAAPEGVLRARIKDKRERARVLLPSN
jgi:hypothetical protein